MTFSYLRLRYLFLVVYVGESGSGEENAGEQKQSVEKGLLPCCLIVCRFV